MSETAFPKPMPPKKPLVAVSQEAIDLGPLRAEQELNLVDYILDGASVPLSGGMAVVIEKAVEKPKYVLKPHLTERPLKGHEGLEALKKQLEDSAPKRAPRRNNKEKK